LSAEFSIAVHCKGWDAAVSDAAQLCRLAAGTAWSVVADRYSAGVKPPEIGLVLTDDEEVAGLNHRFRGLEGATNVLSFPSGEIATPVGDADGPPIVLGDIVIALETTASEALRDAKPMADHLQHLVVHGLLHLLGHDHHRDGDAMKMESLEVEILSRLGVPNPYLDGVDRAQP